MWVILTLALMPNWTWRRKISLGLIGSLRVTRRWLHSRRFDPFQWEIMFGKQLRIGHHQTVSLLGFTCIPEGMPILAMATHASTNCRPKGQSRWIPLGQIQLTLYRPCR